MFCTSQQVGTVGRSRSWGPVKHYCHLEALYFVSKVRNIFYLELAQCWGLARGWTDINWRCCTMLLIITSDVSLTTKKLRNQYLQRREIYIYFYTRQQRNATRQVYFCLSIIMMERQTNGGDDNREQCSITIASSAIQTMETISVQ